MFDFDHFPVLETPRLRLRQILPADAAAVQMMFSHPEVMRYKMMPVFEDEDTARRWIARMQGVFDQRTRLRWGITWAGKDVVIGSIGLRDWDREVCSAETGYDLGFDHWNQGVMTEALRAVAAFGFNAMQLNRIEANAVVDNIASRRTLEKVGFQQEGIRRESDRRAHDGQFFDMAVYGLLAREFTP
ncbi:MAG: GNAT family N-acetyltransferase [Anaerolineae bacterium]